MTRWEVLLLTFLPAVSLAYDWDVIAHVARVDATYIPNQVNIFVDVNAGSCPANNWLYFPGNAGATSNLPVNVQAVYSGLLTALQTGTAIEIYGLNSGCTIQFIHFLNH